MATKKKKKKKKDDDDYDGAPAISMYGDLMPRAEIEKAKGGGFIISYHTRKGYVKEVAETENAAMKKVKKALNRDA